MAADRNPASRAPAELSDLRNPATADAQIRPIPRIAHAIHYARVLQNEIEILGRGVNSKTTEQNCEDSKMFGHKQIVDCPRCLRQQRQL